MSARDAAPLLDLVLKPYRSLSPAGFAAVMGVLVAFNFAGGILFWSLGAWPVLGFMGLDVALVYWALRASYAGAGIEERLSLTADALTVRHRAAGGGERVFTFQPYWLKVEIEAPAGRPTRLLLSSHGRRLAVGAFLAPAERAAVAAALGRALAELKRAPGAAETADRS